MCGEEIGVWPATHWASFIPTLTLWWCLLGCRAQSYISVSSLHFSSSLRSHTCFHGRPFSMFVIDCFCFLRDNTSLIWVTFVRNPDSLGTNSQHCRVTVCFVVTKGNRNDNQIFFPTRHNMLVNFTLSNSIVWSTGIKMNWKYDLIRHKNSDLKQNFMPLLDSLDTSFFLRNSFFNQKKSTDTWFGQTCLTARYSCCHGFTHTSLFNIPWWFYLQTLFTLLSV